MLITALFLMLTSGTVTQEALKWKSIVPGMQLAWLNAKKPSPIGNSRILVIRIDPSRWQLVLVSKNQTGDKNGRTEREWAHDNDLVVAINAGMFAADYNRHVGYMDYRGQVNSGVINHYKSIAAFDPRNPVKSPPFRILDLDEPGITLDSICQEYMSIVQNLRLIKRPGINRWGKQDRKWSEAALGEDRHGRILFVFSRSPFSMHDLNEELLSSEIELLALQHLEGGPEAQLYLNVGGVTLEVVGSYETGFQENNENTSAWKIPNVLGVKRKKVENTSIQVDDASLHP